MLIYNLEFAVQHFRGKFTANFAFLLLPFTGKISYFPGKLTSWNSVGKEDDKVGNKTRYRKEGKRRIKIDLQANYNKQTIKQTTTTNQVQIFAYGYVPKTNWWSLITKKISQKILACSAVVFFRRANILARESAIMKLQSFSVMKSKRRLRQYEHKLAALAKEYWKLYFQPFPCLFGENRSQEGVVGN